MRSPGTLWSSPKPRYEVDRVRNRPSGALPLLGPSLLGPRRPPAPHPSWTWRPRPIPRAPVHLPPGRQGAERVSRRRGRSAALSLPLGTRRPHHGAHPPAGPPPRPTVPTRPRPSRPPRRPRRPRDPRPTPSPSRQPIPSWRPPALRPPPPRPQDFLAPAPGADSPQVSLSPRSRPRCRHPSPRPCLR
jgi:hypothetical protein